MARLRNEDSRLHMVRIRLSSSTIELLKNLASEQRVSLSGVVRGIVEGWARARSKVKKIRRRVLTTDPSDVR